MSAVQLYVIQVSPGAEGRTRQLLLHDLPELVEDCFTPAYETRRARQGQWHTVQELLFPGYLFVETSDPAALRHQMEAVPKFTRLLGGTNDRFMSLSSDEVAWLNALTDAKTHVVGMSEGVIEGDEVRITKGPLRGMEAQIARIDRHKRLAELDIWMCGRKKRVKVGLEIVRKRP